MVVWQLESKDMRSDRQFRAVTTMKLAWPHLHCLRDMWAWAIFRDLNRRFPITRTYLYNQDLPFYFSLLLTLCTPYMHQNTAEERCLHPYWWCESCSCVCGGCTSRPWAETQSIASRVGGFQKPHNLPIIAPWWVPIKLLDSGCQKTSELVMQIKWNLVAIQAKANHGFIIDLYEGEQ